MHSEAASLIDALEALCVLHSHEEFLSQVLKRVVSRQIQAVEAGGEKCLIGKLRKMNTGFGFEIHSNNFKVLDYNMCKPPEHFKPCQQHDYRTAM